MLCASASVADDDDDELKENIPESKRSKEEGTPDDLLVSPSRRPLMEKGSVHLAYYSEAEGTQGAPPPPPNIECLSREILLLRQHLSTCIYLPPSLPPSLIQSLLPSFSPSLPPSLPPSRPEHPARPHGAAAVDAGPGEGLWHQDH